MLWVAGERAVVGNLSSKTLKIASLKSYLE